MPDLRRRRAPGARPAPPDEVLYVDLNADTRDDAPHHDSGTTAASGTVESDVSTIAPPAVNSAVQVAGHVGSRIACRVIRSARRRRTIELSVEGAAVVVRVPLRTSEQEIREVVRHRAGWIRRRLAGAAAPAALVAGGSIPYRGRPLALTVVAGSIRRACARLDLFGLHVEVPRGLEGEEAEEAVRGALVAWLRERAAETIALHVERRAAGAERRPRRVVVRDQRRRWGSCAADGTLRFNWRLVMLDEALVDYVAVHEIAHLRFANHSPAFWRGVERVLPGYRTLRRRLNEEGRQLPL